VTVGANRTLERRRLGHGCPGLPRRVLVGLAAAIVLGGTAMVEPVKLYAAGSLTATLGAVAKDFSAKYGVGVDTTFAPSGLLRERIEAGEVADVFTSADMRHPRTLMEVGKGSPVVLFARNQLCALTRPGLGVTSASLLDVVLDPGIKLGTSTPNADPSGDYAWKLFEQAETLRPGSYAKLDAKALKLTGRPDSAKAPEGRNQYAWVITEGFADVFLTYRTNATLARKDAPALDLVEVPPELAVGADYGLTVLAPNNPDAAKLAFYILSPDGQKTLERFGFTPVGIEQST
jgi:molybdate transport system substrate-binding protein